MVEAGLGNYDIEGSADKADQTNDTDRVDASMKNVAQAVEKLFCPKGIYEKGDQMNFAQFMLKYYPDALLMHLERACSGARHDICCETALAILLNRPYYLKYLQSRILWHRDKKKNKLICALYAILSSRQMTACLRVMCVFDVAIVKQHCMFAGKSHVLHQSCDNWKGSASMCDIADGIYDALVELKKHPEKFLDQQYMMSIFDKWKTGNAQVEEWHAYTFIDRRKTNTVGNTTKQTRVFTMDEVLKTIFTSNDPAIIEINKDSQTTGLKAVVRFMEEMLSQKPGKATHKFMLCIDGPQSWKAMSSEEKEASVGRMDTNDLREHHFSNTKYEKQKFGTNLTTLNAGAVATMKTTGLMKHVLGDTSAERGYWHNLDKTLQNMIVTYAERSAFGAHK